MTKFEELKEIKHIDIEKGMMYLTKPFTPLCKLKGKEVWINDGLDCKAFRISNDASKYNLRFCGLKNWYKERNIQSGTKINIIFDESEIFENLHIIHIEYNI